MFIDNLSSQKLSDAEGINIVAYYENEYHSIENFSFYLNYEHQRKAKNDWTLKKFEQNRLKPITPNEMKFLYIDKDGCALARNTKLKNARMK